MAKKNLTIIQGSTFELLIPVLDANGLPLDMVGYVGGTAGARGKMFRRTSEKDTGTPAATFTCSIVNKSAILALMKIGQFDDSDVDIAKLEPDSSGSCYVLARLNSSTTLTLTKPFYEFYYIKLEDTYNREGMLSSGSITVLPGGD